MDGQWQPKGIAIILITLITLFGIYQAGPIVTDFIDWIFGLFRNAGFYSDRAISAFVQLIAVVVTACWAINRFRR
ncbi:hypothetical protein KA005_42370 [bacterium]|nr:hypothetical protein [bacterium]